MHDEEDAHITRHVLGKLSTSRLQNRRFRRSLLWRNRASKMGSECVTSYATLGTRVLCSLSVMWRVCCGRCLFRGCDFLFYLRYTSVVVFKRVLCRVCRGCLCLFPLDFRRNLRTSTGPTHSNLAQVQFRRPYDRGDCGRCGNERVYMEIRTCPLPHHRHDKRDNR